MYVGLYAICVWNWNWWLTQDHFLIKHWSQRTHRCSAVRCWPWVVFSSWLASHDLRYSALQLLGVSGACDPHKPLRVSRCRSHFHCFGLTSVWSHRSMPGAQVPHYRDIIMSAMPSQITGFSGFGRGIHRSPVDSPHTGPMTRKIFPFDDVIKEHRLLHHE